ncbi:unnamed protein product [Parascedosporium putredinis]|uniref:AMMECR1 domain-containing protein n=1 Tax=Parascedosporium putredinis TaxID=1442378 RepID=A0A9P1H298_9PEZI|nr:unnamed protein product [Parascedosporium putredinis]CAI7994723.1 unnamed protein product [Parascedosporium putredinis]
MATAEHCLYAFEALVAHLERRQPMELADIQKSWAAYLASGASSGTKLSKALPALHRLAAAAADQSSGTSSQTRAPPYPWPPTPPRRPSPPSPGATTPRYASPRSSSPGTSSPRTPATRTTAPSAAASAPLRTRTSRTASPATLTSALHDTRFNPIRASELPTLEVAVTLLTDFEDAADTMDWSLGVHGIRISFVYHGRRYGATYLPDVAVEQGWTKEETIVSLMRKAGWVGRKDRWRDVEVDTVRYQGKKESLAYPEYRNWRDWIDETKWET